MDTLQETINKANLAGQKASTITGIPFSPLQTDSLTGLANNAGVAQTPVSPSLDMSQIEQAGNIQPAPDIPRTSANIINSIAQAPSAVGDDTAVRQTEDEFSSLVKRMRGRSAAEAELTEDVGIPEIERQIRDIGTDIQMKRAALTAGLVDQEGRPIAQNFITGRQAQMQRIAAAEAEGLFALQSAVQGQLTTAQGAVERALNARFAPIQEEIEIQKELLSIRKEQMTRDQQKRAEERQAFLTRLESQVEQAKEREERGYNAINTAITNGFDVAKGSKLMTDITNGNISPEEAIAQLGQFAGDVWGNTIKRLQVAKLQQDIKAGQDTGTGGGKPLTASQSAALGYGERLLQSSLIIDEIGNDFTGVASRFAGWLPGGLKSEDRQRFEQAQRNFVNSVLRRESGAAISPEEFESAQLQYFPQPGDKQGVLIQKKQNRDLVTKNILREAGVDTSPQDISLNDPLGIGITSETTNPLDI